MKESIEQLKKLNDNELILLAELVKNELTIRRIGYENIKKN